MPGSKTAFGAGWISDLILGANTANPIPANWYLALSAAAFDPNMTGAVPTELVGGGYTRLGVPNNLTTTFLPIGGPMWPAVKSNAADLIWPAATADWQAVPAAVYLCLSATGADAVYGTDLTGVGGVSVGQQFTLPARSLIFSEK